MSGRMAIVRGARLLALACALLGARSALAAPGEPDLGASLAAVCRPTFIKDGKPSQAGTGFILHAPAFADHDLLVSAHHLFQMASADSSGMPWQEVGRRVTGASCKSLDGERTWRASAALPIAGVRAFWRVPEVKDVALLPVVSGPPSRLELSPVPARPGDVVYVLAPVEHALPTDTTIHRARVIPAQGFLAFIYDGPFDTANISGAPIVNAEGKLVGVNVGAGRSPQGVELGVGDDMDALQAALAAAR